MASYWLGLARDSDARDIFRLVFENPPPFVRQVSFDQVLSWIDQGACWIIRDLARNQIVAACYINVPLTTPDDPPEPAEFSGLYVDPNHRKHGIGTALGVLALSSYFWDNDPDKLDPTPILAHVHVDNVAPRSLLQHFGFVHVQTITVPSGTRGFEHMPIDDEGVIRGDEFKFQPEVRARLFRKMGEYLSTARLAKTGVGIELDVGPGMTPEALEDLAAQLEASMRT